MSGFLPFEGTFGLLSVSQVQDNRKKNEAFQGFMQERECVLTPSLSSLTTYCNVVRCL